MSLLGQKRTTHLGYFISAKQIEPDAVPTAVLGPLRLLALADGVIE